MCIYFCVFQVTTRFIASSSPVIYWFVASVTMPAKTTETKHEEQSNVGSETNRLHNSPEIQAHSLSDSVEYLCDFDNSSVFQRMIYLYFLLYFFVGAAAFPNWLPWT